MSDLPLGIQLKQKTKALEKIANFNLERAVDLRIKELTATKNLKDKIALGCYHYNDAFYELKQIARDAL